VHLSTDDKKLSLSKNVIKLFDPQSHGPMVKHQTIIQTSSGDS
jgi:hypothetical protein